MLILLFFKNKSLNQILIMLMMNKLNLISGLLLALLSLTITSCEKEKPLSEAIIGKWEVQNETVVIYENNIKKESHTNFLEANAQVYQFAEGGTGIYSENGEVKGTFSWTVESNTLTFTGGSSDIESTVTHDNDILVWSYKMVDSQNSSISYEYITTTKKIN
jgi:hypothetical protein